MKSKKYILAITAVVLLGLVSCVNLRTLNSYSEKSIEGVKKFKEVDFSFKSICENDCELEQNAKESSIDNKIDTVYRPILIETECDCGQYLLADSSFNKIYFASLQYLEGLYKLSSDDILEFDYDTLANALKETDLLGVKEKEIDAFNKLVNLTTRFIVDIKRRKDLQNIISEANSPFQQLMDRLKFAVDEPFLAALENEIDLHYNYYKAIVYNHKELSLRDKVELENEFKESKRKIENKKQLLLDYSKILEEVKKGHQSLFENKDKIHKKEIASLIAKYLTEMEEIKTEFDNLKTEE
jgi:hypothetical protein